ncbi:MAG: ATP-dependent Clp protease proteolytic subunit [Oscillospiraceae bacterium]|nr:ATP-dependent Clp protease proteolytic subunit [Oscillospiraceae bacterium]
MNNVYYVERTANGSNQISLKSKLLERRVIYLDCEINGESVGDIIRQISLLSADDPEGEITMLINSPGGSIQEGLVLIDVMRSHKGAINTVSLGIAASMAAVILAAGTKGHRYISKSSQAMLHQPLISGGVPAGSCSEVEGVAKSLIARKKQLDDLLVTLTERPRKEILKLTAKDTYLNAEEALKYGLVDKIAEGEELNRLIGGAAI